MEDDIGILLDTSSVASYTTTLNNKRRRIESANNDFLSDDEQTIIDDDQPLDDTSLANGSEEAEQPEQSTAINLSSLAKFTSLQLGRLMKDQADRVQIKELSKSKKAKFWKNFRDVHVDGVYCGFVQCQCCEKLLQYEKGSGTAPISYHHHHCPAKVENQARSQQPSVQSFVIKKALPLPAEHEMIRAAAIAAAVDLRPFSLFQGLFSPKCEELLFRKQFPYFCKLIS